MSRVIQRQYMDPLDAIWLTTASRLGFTVERSSEVYAAFDGKQSITIGTADTLDADDCLAQMILHELCHALVQGPHEARSPDWGLTNTDDRDVINEHACLRLQAALTERVGLRVALGPTTDFRRYYDALGHDPFDPIDDPASALARAGLERSGLAPWEPHLAEALRSTASILEEVRRLGACDPQGSSPAIWQESD